MKHLSTTLLAALSTAMAFFVVSFFLGYAAGIFLILAFASLPVLYLVLRVNKSPRLFGSWSVGRFAIYLTSLVAFLFAIRLVFTAFALYGGNFHCGYLDLTWRKTFHYENGVCTGE